MTDTVAPDDLPRLWAEFLRRPMEAEFWTRPHWQRVAELIDRADWLKALPELLQTAQKYVKRPFPHPKSNRFPYSSTFFTGRTAELQAVAEGLKKGNVVLYGPDGMGKSSIAFAYAYRNVPQDGRVFLIAARRPEVYRTQMAALASMLDLPVQRGTDDQFTAVVQRLGEEGDWLLILDDVVDFGALGGLPEHPTGRILATAHSRPFDSARFETSVGVGPLDDATAAMLLLRRIDPIRRASEIPAGPGEVEAAGFVADAQAFADARRLAFELKGFPLALAQAGGCTERSSLDLKTYFERYRAERVARPTDEDDLTTIVATTTRIAMAEMETASSYGVAAQFAVGLGTFLGSEGIPFDLYQLGANIFPPTWQALVEDDASWRFIVRLAHDFSLWQEEADMVVIHPLTAAAIRDALDETSREERFVKAIEMTVAALSEIVPDASEIDGDEWVTIDRVFPHALHLGEEIRSQGLSAAAVPHFLSSLGLILLHKGRLSDAASLLRDNLALQERTAGRTLDSDNLRQRAITLGNLGLTLIEMGDYAQATTVLEEAVATEQSRPSPDTLSLALNVERLAEIDLRQNRPPETLPRVRRTLVQIEERFGSESVTLAQVLHPLARGLTRMGEAQEAETMLRRCLRIAEATGRAEHPDTLPVLADLGVVALNEGRFDEAESPLGRYLEGADKIYDKNHLACVHARELMAALNIYRAQREAAFRILHEALEIGGRLHALDHPRCRSVQAILDLLNDS